MKRLIFCITFLFLAAYGQAQFRLAVNGTPSWTNLGGGLYSATVTFHSDLTGNSYAVAGIVDTMRLFTGRGQVFEVDSVWGKTFSQATLRVEYLEGVSSAPVGQCMVYDPFRSIFVPDIAFGSTGATAQLNQSIVSYNAAKSGQIDDLALLPGDTILVAYNSAGGEVWRDTIAGGGGSASGTSFGSYYTSSFQDTAWMENYDDFQKKIVRAGGPNFGESDLLGRNFVLNPPDSIFKTYSIPFSVTLTDQQAFSSLDFSDYRYSGYRGYPYATVAYVDAVAGNDANSGVNWSTAKKTINLLINADSEANPDIIFVKGKYVYYDNGLASLTAVYRPVTIIGVQDSNGEYPTLLAGDTMTWVASPYAAYTNIFYCLTKGGTNLASTPPVVLDTRQSLNAYGDWTPASRQTSFANVNATENSYYVIEAGAVDTVYFNPTGSPTLAAEDSIFVFRDRRHGVFNRKNDYFFENISFWGGRGAPNIGASATGYRLDTLDLTRAFFKNCQFKYANGNTDGGAGFTLSNEVEIYLEDCLASSNYDDGFNYHEATTNGKVYENRCVAYWNGFATNWTSTTSGDNGSTAHDTIAIVRLNGLYYDTGGTPINDVNESKTWMVNCTAYNTLGLSGQAAIGLANAGGWVDYCKVPIATNTNQYEYDGPGGNMFLRWSYRGWTSTPSLGTTNGTITIKK